MNDLIEAIAQLTRRMESLEGRVFSLESAPRPRMQPFPPVPSLTVAGGPAVVLPQQAGIFSVLGKAMLAIAGAYLLRALAESAVLPHVAVFAVAIAYAFLWIVPATRASAKAWLASFGWAATSALILLPMLWELVLRFHALPTTLAAAILVAWAIAASALAWKRHFTEVAWVVDGAASIAALALALATHDLPPFLVALLLIAALGEVAAARHRTLRVRPLVAAAADFAVFNLIWVYSSPAAARPDYLPVHASLLLVVAPLLLLIYAGSASTQTLLLRRRISFFETAQTLVAFLLAVWGMLEFWSGPAARLLGLLCLVCSAAGYSLSFFRFQRAQARRNFHVYSAGSLALLLVGCSLFLPQPWLPVCLSVLSVAAIVIGISASQPTLDFHAYAALLAAVVSSGLPIWTGQTLAGAFPAAPRVPMLCAAAAAAIAYGALARSPIAAWWLQGLRLMGALLAVGAAASLMVWGLVSIFAGATPQPAHVALIRTLTACVVALALAWRGSRGSQRELVWLAWATLGLGALKLLVEDLRLGSRAFTAGSIFLYAVTLLLLPRLVRPGSARHDL